MMNLLNRTLDELQEHPIAHVAILADEDAKSYGNVWFVLIDVTAGALCGGVVCFCLSLEAFPHKIGLQLSSNLGDYASQVSSFWLGSSLIVHETLR